MVSSENPGWKYTPTRQASRLRKEESLIRLVPGILALFACVALALQNIGSYYRHLSTGDQAGFALGNAFLVLWFLPIADTFLLIGTIGFAPPQTRRESRWLRGVAMASLIAGGAFFLAYWLWPAVMQALQHLADPRTSWRELLEAGPYMATCLALALTMLACGLAVRPGSESPRDGGPTWLLGAILAVLAIVIIPVAAFIVTGGLRMYVAQPGLSAQLLFMAFPALVWVATLLWSAWLLHHRREAARSLIPILEEA